MKIFTFTISLLLISIVNFAQSSICPNYFRRNNGNGLCPDGQLKLYFTSCPANAPIIDSVYTNGVKANISFALPDISKCSSQGYVSYCVNGGNMPPAALWQIYFHNPGSTDPFGCLVPEGGVLPIAIENFFAKRNNNTVSLNWRTSFESNAIGFDIQRKTIGGFLTIATVPATNITNGSTYSYIDNNNMKTVSEYRLLLHSKDADASFSETRNVKGTGGSIDFIIFPNPTAGNVKVSITDISEPTDVQVIDNTGRVIKTIMSVKNSSIELDNLQSGVYRISMIIKSTGERTTKTLTVIQ